MAQQSYPFDAGAGAAVTETDWRRMARLFSPTGVETGLVVSAGTGSNVNVSAGSVYVDGHYYRTDATVAVPFTPNTLAQPQVVRVVARLDPTANAITLACTTTAVVQQPTGVYELPLAEFTLPPSGTAQTPTGLVDRRRHLNEYGGGMLLKSGLTTATTEPNGNFTILFPEPFPTTILWAWAWADNNPLTSFGPTLHHSQGKNNQGFWFTVHAAVAPYSPIANATGYRVQWLAIGR